VGAIWTRVYSLGRSWDLRLASFVGGASVNKCCGNCQWARLMGDGKYVYCAYGPMPIFVYLHSRQISRYLPKTAGQTCETFMETARER
jgi:hypothetical protein